MAETDARVMAVSILFHQEGRRVPLETLFQTEAFEALSRRDQALARRLIDGVMRNLLRLDFYLGRLSRRSLRKLDREIAWILRVSLYQMEFLRVPDYAVLNEAARMCVTFRKGSAKGFVNGVLRSFQRKKPPLPSGEGPEPLSIRHSHPQWLVRRYLRRWGTAGTARYLDQNNRLPGSFLWINPFKNSREEFVEKLEAEEVGYRIVEEIPDCVEILSSGFSHHPLYRKGCCFFMDPSSQQVAGLVSVPEKGILGDLCAAPGGKSFLLASRLPPGSSLFCCDVNPSRLRAMRDRARHYGVPGLAIIQADLSRPAPFGRTFDRILLDVPCSGLGTIRSNPEIRWRAEEADLAGHQRRQSLILRQAFEALQSNGELLYSTCSTEPEENEEVVEAFLAREEQARQMGPFFRTYPEGGPGDGFFACRIRRI